MKQPSTREQLQEELMLIRAKTLQLQKMVFDLRNQQARCSRAILEMSTDAPKTTTPRLR